MTADIAALASGARCPTPRRARGWPEPFRTLAWASLMTRPRRTLLRRHLERMGGPRRPTVLINHLVDYVWWLDDRPRSGSDAAAQEAFWAVAGREAAAMTQPVRLATFAGFCPLRAAIERQLRQPASLDRQLAAIGRGDLAGLKVYPPMGFRPSGNAGLTFAGWAGPGRDAAAKWAATGAVRPLGEALDEALETAFARCAAAGVPILAHAGPGNSAGRGFGDRANPRHWAPVLQRHRLRLLLGHLVNDAAAFVAAVDCNGPQADVWALTAARDLLAADSDPARGQAWGDLSYMPELIGDADFTRRFFVALRAVFAPRDRDLTRIVHGSDWIMLGREPRNSAFAGAVLAGMQAAEFTDTQIDNIMARNTLRFLDGR